MNPQIRIGPDLIKRYDDDDYWDELDEWEDDHPEIACISCGRPGIDCCQCCGGYLCGMHSEIGCGFCSECPTQEWIDEQDTLAAAQAVAAVEEAVG